MNRERAGVSIPRLIAAGSLPVLLALMALSMAGPAAAVETTVTSSDTPGCDTLAPVPSPVSELGTAPPFPTGSQIAAIVATTTSSPCGSVNDNPLIPNALVSITNLNTVAFTDVWYAANAGTMIGNIDGTINGAPAFKIDAVGINTPLLHEGGVADGIFSPGETWTFVIQDYDNPLLPASAINGVGVPDPVPSAASGSIVARAVGAPACGDGTLNPGEMCDDGNTTSGDGCSSTCQTENVPPDCSRALADSGVLWPPNHSFRAVSIDGVVDPNESPLTIAVTGIKQDEALRGNGDGNTCPDGSGVGTSTALLRAERATTGLTGGNGRVYHVHFTATNQQGATCSGVVKVCVPKDQGKLSCVDDGERVDSTGPCR